MNVYGFLEWESVESSFRSVPAREYTQQTWQYYYCAHKCWLRFPSISYFQSAKTGRNKHPHTRNHIHPTHCRECIPALIIHAHRSSANRTQVGTLCSSAHSWWYNNIITYRIFRNTNNSRTACYRKGGSEMYSVRPGQIYFVSVHWCNSERLFSVMNGDRIQ
jgi:hypothetical protein